MNLDVFEKSGIATSVENNKAPLNLVQLKHSIEWIQKFVI